MTATLTEREVRDLGRAEGGDDTLARLALSQHTQRLLLLRLLLDAVDATPGPAAAPARDHARLLEAAERAAPGSARRVLFYSLTGPWAERCVQWLETGADPGADPAAAGDLAHLGSLAAAVAARSGLGFTTRVVTHGGRLTLPTLGALRGEDPDGTPVELSGDGPTLTIRPAGRPPVEVRQAPAGVWLSDDPRWLPLHTLDGGPRTVLLDDLDPGRLVYRSGAVGVAARDVLRPEERAHWAALWRAALPLVSLAGTARTAELALLDCIVPLSAPDAASSGGISSRAFGAVMTTPPPSPLYFAAGLAHEIQHLKLTALSDLTPLARVGPEARHWAPWRPDPRPFHGLLHGTYAHLALADFWQRLALTLDDPADRDHAWAAHARCWTQVGAVLPVLTGTRRLTEAGRVFVHAVAERHEELREPAPPRGHLVRAAAYVDTARTLWLRQHGR
ncbi:aKG-HExxH-type peptide beta-hydroxylase [Streptomyces sp. URMC 129]|uniref:aKG-HExxH-type peptide beta-hydroxylase n=1 Tax=Streptomyces sp. URMC 129 TaxID=3423407 RepID=UPI003F1C186F